MTGAVGTEAGQFCPTQAAGTGGTTGTEIGNPTFSRARPGEVGQVGQGGSPLKGGTPRLSRPGVPPLSPAQVEAAKVFASAYEVTQTPTARAVRRMWAVDTVRWAGRHVDAAEFALLVLHVGRGVALADLAARTGRVERRLCDQLSGALRKLANALEAQSAAEAG